MGEKSTKELTDILKKTHISRFEKYCRENRDSIINPETEFSVYMKNIFRSNGLTQQYVFLQADIPERYGYKLLSGEKVTRQRDIILRICYAGKLNLDETQRALKKYGLAALYVKIPRDALLMIAFEQRPGSVIDVNEILIKNKMEPLRTSGAQE